jgi:hypothetical protein
MNHYVEPSRKLSAAAQPASSLLCRLIHASCKESVMRYNKSRLTLPALLLAASMVFTSGCARSIESRATKSGQEPVSDLRAAYQVDCVAPNPPDKGKGDWTRRIHQCLVVKLRSLPESLFDQVLEYSLASSEADSGTSDEFDANLAEAFVDIFVTDGNRQMLVKLLAAKCLNHYGYGAIEFFIVGWYKQPFTDPILIFVDAYRDSHSDKNRETIVAILQSSFTGLVPFGAGGPDFVDRCEEFYQKNKEHLVVNVEYCNSYTVSCPRRPSPPMALFIMK